MGNQCLTANFINSKQTNRNNSDDNKIQIDSIDISLKNNILNVNVINQDNNDFNASDEIPLEIWKKYDFSSTNNFCLKDTILVCRIVDIYDGDTCTCVIPLFSRFYKFTVRLADIDTCEMKSKTDTNKELAYKARMYLFNLVTKKIYTELDLHISRKDMRKILNDNIYLTFILCGEFDKYGRLLGWLFNLSENINKKELFSDKSISFNHLLIKNGLAYFYEGDTKLTEEEQIKKLNN